MEPVSQPSAPRQEAVASVAKHYHYIADTFPDAVTHFERQWAAWNAVCLAQAAVGTSLDKCIETDEFEVLKRLGPKIIPFVVFKLARDYDDDDRNLCGVFLYNALESDAMYRAAPESPVSKEVLWRLSSRIVELNHQRNQILEERVGAWIAYHNKHWVQSSSFFFTLCDEYWDLLEMGTSIIAPAMVEYAHLQWGYWFQLLHEIIHGRQLGAHSYQKGVLFDECVRWFNEGDHSEAPLYVPTELDRYILSDTQPWVPRGNPNSRQS